MLGRGQEGHRLLVVAPRRSWELWKEQFQGNGDDGRTLRAENGDHSQPWQLDGAQQRVVKQPGREGVADMGTFWSSGCWRDKRNCSLVVVWLRTPLEDLTEARTDPLSANLTHMLRPPLMNRIRRSSGAYP